MTKYASQILSVNSSDSMSAASAELNHFQNLSKNSFSNSSSEDSHPESKQSLYIN